MESQRKTRISWNKQIYVVNTILDKLVNIDVNNDEEGRDILPLTSIFILYGKVVTSLICHEDTMKIDEVGTESHLMISGAPH